MATPKWSPKDPQDIRDYWINFATLGLAEDETLVDATVTIEAGQHDAESPYGDLEKVTSAIADDTWVVVRVSGGTPAKYLIQYHVTTSTGQEFDLTKTLEVKERTA
jgi:inosine/xanthosine triphosphate pyrophosphatase family protein